MNPKPTNPWSKWYKLLTSIQLAVIAAFIVDMLTVGRDPSHIFNSLDWALVILFITILTFFLPVTFILWGVSQSRFRQRVESGQTISEKININWKKVAIGIVIYIVLSVLLSAYRYSIGSRTDHCYANASFPDSFTCHFK